MEVYRTSSASSHHLPQLADMSAEFSTADPLMDIILQGSVNSLELRKEVARHRYNWALVDSGPPDPRSKVWISYNSPTSYLIEASAWVQYFRPDPSWQIPWKDEPETFKTVPHVNAHLYRHIENALHTNRKTYMEGKCHYYIHQLDFRLFENPMGSKKAAKHLLSHISTFDPHVDIYAHFRPAHHEILEGLGWEFLDGVNIGPAVSESGMRVTFAPSRESWMRRGLKDLDKGAASTASNSLVPTKLDSASSI